MADTSVNTDKPVLNVLTQYVRDLSFESPNLPGILRVKEQVPPINISVSVNAATLEENHYEVILNLGARAGEGKDLVFNIELVYGGVFRIQHFARKHMTPIIFIECPRLLFPFARQIIADATRNAGFPPLMVDPIDFTALLQHRLAEENARAQVQTSENQEISAT